MAASTKRERSQKHGKYAIRRLTNIIKTYADESEKLGRLHPKVHSALLEAQLFRMLMPRIYNGLEVDPLHFFEAIYEAAQIDGSTAWCLCQGNGCAMASAYMDPGTARAVFGTDPKAVLAWGPGNASATVFKDGYLLSGRIGFASGGRNATWLGCHVPIFELNGAQRIGVDGNPEIRTMIFSESAVRWIDNWDVIGLRATGSDDFKIEELFVPEKYTTIRDHPKHRIHNTSLFVMTSMTMYAIGFSATAQGIARAMVESFKDLAKEKTPRLSKTKVKDNPVIHSDLAYCEARLRAAKALLITETESIWNEIQLTKELSIAQRMRIRLAATHGIHEAKAVAETIYDLAGVSAIRAESPFQRRYRDIRSVTQQLQGRRSHFQTVGAYLLGNSPDLSVI